jgi:hypothetical protein
LSGVYLGNKPIGCFSYTCILSENVRRIINTDDVRRTQIRLATYKRRESFPRPLIISSPPMNKDDQLPITVRLAYRFREGGELSAYRHGKTREQNQSDNANQFWKSREVHDLSHCTTRMGMSGAVEMPQNRASSTFSLVITLPEISSVGPQSFIVSSTLLPRIS